MSALLGAGLGVCPGTALAASKSELPFKLFGEDPRGTARLLLPLTWRSSRCFKPGLLPCDMFWTWPDRGVPEEEFSFTAAPDLSAGIQEGVDLL